MTMSLRHHPSGDHLKPSRKKSLVTRLTWVSILSVTLALSAVGTGLIFIAGKSLHNAAFRSQQQSAERVSQRISGYMTLAVDRLRFFLENSTLAVQSAEQQKITLENLLITSLPLYSQIAISDRQGNERAKISRFHTFLPADLVSQDRHPAFAAAIRGRTYLGAVAFLEDTGLLSVSVALPVKTPAAGIVGAMMAEINVSHLWQDVARMDVGRGGYAYPVDRNGRFVAYQKPAEVLQRYGEEMSGLPPVSDFIGGNPDRGPAVYEYRGLVDETVIGAHSPIEGTPWAVIVEQPTREAYAGVSEMKRLFWSLLFLCTLSAGGLTFFIARYLIRPIRTLTAAARRFGAGELETDFIDVHRQDEVGVLSHAFNKMQAELRGLYAGLRGKVEELEVMQRELRESEENFRTLVEESPLGISLIGQDGRYRYINPRFRELFGYSLKDVPSGSEWFRKAFPDREHRRKVIGEWVGDMKQTGIGHSRPRVYTVTCKDGSRSEIGFRPVTMENLDQIVIYEDVSEKMKMERQLQQAQKFEAIGTLAGGIAHDFNNLLMGIQGRTSLISADMDLYHPNAEHIDAIETYIRSATDLTRQLLGFARGGKYEVKPFDINDLVSTSATMFGRTRKEIHIHTRFQEPTPVVAADRSQIEQVLLNMFVNAWQAMPDGGDLYLDTRTVTLDDASCSPHQAEPGRYAKISITDTGIGMTEAVRLRIFDPFFTTKGMGRGTGLGLASAYGIIKNHGGFINVYSEEGNGSTFNIYLPLSDKAIVKERRSLAEIQPGSGTILLVDDEQMIIDVGKHMLEKLGYRVRVACNGEEALELYRRAFREIDIVVLDMIMPDMGGGEVFDRLRQVHPDARVILSSGYSINGKAAEILERGCDGFIQKPFTLQELSRKLAGVAKK